MTAEDFLQGITYTAADAGKVRVKSYLRGGKRVKAHMRGGKDKPKKAETSEERAARATREYLESLTEEERRRSEVIMKQIAIATAMFGTEKYPPTGEDPFKAAGLKRVMPKERK